jgi:hypothetical protein
MLAIVIGEGGYEGDHFNWGWYVYENKDYRQLLANELTQRFVMHEDEHIELRRADADGIWKLYK